MRPMYESSQDKAHEAQVIARLCSAWKCDAQKMPVAYPVDWSLKQGKEVKALAEIKFRNASYDTYIVGLRKYSDMLNLHQASGLPCLLVVCWPEGGKRVIKYTTITSKPTKVIHGGRTDRGDSQDVEPMAEIAMSEFKTVGEL